MNLWVRYYNALALLSIALSFWVPLPDTMLLRIAFTGALVAAACREFAR